MNQQSQPTDFQKLSDRNKKLIKMYAKSALSNAAISLVSDESLNLRNVNFSEVIQSATSKLLEYEPDTDLNALIDEALEPLQATFSDDVLLGSLGKVKCFIICTTDGGSSSECKQKCKLDWIQPLDESAFN